jgi:hypothetical protein
VKQNGAITEGHNDRIAKPKSRDAGANGDRSNLTLLAAISAIEPDDFIFLTGTPVSWRTDHICLIFSYQLAE